MSSTKWTSSPILTGQTFSQNKMVRKLSVFSSLMFYYSFDNHFCQKIIIYLESLCNKLYFDIKFIWKYWKMNSTWQHRLFHRTKWRENYQCSRLWCQIIRLIIICQKIIIYLESLYNKLYFDIKFIWKYWKMNSKSWQDGLFHGTKWRENYQCSDIWCQIILFIIISIKR